MISGVRLAAMRPTIPYRRPSWQLANSSSRSARRPEQPVGRLERLRPQVDLTKGVAVRWGAGRDIRWERAAGEACARGSGAGSRRGWRRAPPREPGRMGVPSRCPPAIRENCGRRVRKGPGAPADGASAGARTRGAGAQPPNRQPRVPDAFSRIRRRGTGSSPARPGCSPIGRAGRSMEGNPMLSCAQPKGAAAAESKSMAGRVTLDI